MKSGRRTGALLFIVLAAASATGCFALFSLDDYGPPGPPVDAAVIIDVEAGPVSNPDAAPIDTRAKKRVFVTSTTSNGNLEGTKGADLTCQTLATEAGLSGTFRAWLTVDKDTPPTRLFAQRDGDAGLPDVRLVDTIGRTVAVSWTQLLSTKAPLVPIEHTERGIKLNSADAGVKSNDQGVACNKDPSGQVTTFLPVWTNTKGDGTVNEFDVDCQNFLSIANNTTARIGIVASDAGWTDFDCAYACTLKARLYCFEQ